MSFSRMKRTTFFSGALSALVVSLLVSSVATDAFAIKKDDDEDRFSDGSVCEQSIESGSRRSLAQQLSELKEARISTDEEIDATKEEIARLEKKMKKFDKWEDLDDEDPVLTQYGRETCLCAGTPSCSYDSLLGIGAINDSDFETRTLPGCVNQPVKGGGQGDPDERQNVNALKKGKKNNSVANNNANNEAEGVVNEGNDTPAKNEKGKKGGSSTPCPVVKVIKKSVNQATVCKALYDYYTANRRDPYSNSATISSTCVAAAKKCGPVKKDIELAKIPGQIKDLKAELKRLQKLSKKCIAKINLIKTECPDCTSIAAEVDGDYSGKKTTGDYIINGLAVAMPGIMKGMDMAMYYKGVNGWLSGTKAYYGANQANCAAYINQGTTLGIPSSPCQSAMWAGGMPMANGYGAYGVGGFGVGGLYGVGLYGAAYGAAYGGGAVGTAIGSLYASSFGAPGVGVAFGGGYAPQIGMAVGGGYAGGFAPGYGGYGSFAGGYGPQIGMAVGGGYAGGFAPGFGGYGGYGPQIGMAMGNPAMGAGYSSIAGGYNGIGGGYMAMGTGFNGGFNGGFGMDPSFQLEQQRAQMQQQNMMISQQQIAEAQNRYQQIATPSGYGSIGGGSYGYGYGIGGYGYGYGYGYGGMPSAVGTAIGTLIGGGIGGQYGIIQY
jgi:hypothetical protein